MVQNGNSDRYRHANDKFVSREVLYRELALMREFFREGIAAEHQLTKQQFAALRENTALALGAADKALAKAETATERRFESVNEWRGQSADRERDFMPRSEATAKIDGLSKDMAELKEIINKAQGGLGGITSSVALALAVLSILVAFATLMMSRV